MYGDAGGTQAAWDWIARGDAVRGGVPEGVHEQCVAVGWKAAPERRGARQPRYRAVCAAESVGVRELDEGDVSS